MPCCTTTIKYYIIITINIATAIIATIIIITISITIIIVILDYTNETL